MDFDEIFRITGTLHMEQLLICEVSRITIWIHFLIFLATFARLFHAPQGKRGESLLSGD